MATRKSNQSPRSVALRNSAPAATPLDPYLLPDTIETETISFAGVALPPIVTGMQPGLDLSGKPELRKVRAINVNRRHIDNILRALEQERPDLEILLKVIRGYICSLDSTRDSATWCLAMARSALKEGCAEKALEKIDVTGGVLGTWSELHRLIIR